MKMMFDSIRRCLCSRLPANQGPLIPPASRGSVGWLPRQELVVVARHHQRYEGVCSTERKVVSEKFEGSRWNVSRSFAWGVVAWSTNVSTSCWTTQEVISDRKTFVQKTKRSLRTQATHGPQNLAARTPRKWSRHPQMVLRDS